MKPQHSVSQSLLAILTGFETFVECCVGDALSEIDPIRSRECWSDSSISPILRDQLIPVVMDRISPLFRFTTPSAAFVFGDEGFVLLLSWKVGRSFSPGAKYVRSILQIISHSGFGQRAASRTLSQADAIEKSQQNLASWCVVPLQLYRHGKNKESRRKYMTAVWVSLQTCFQLLLTVPYFSSWRS
jgi:hypothetical protein